jgi:hypothetical protein
MKSPYLVSDPQAIQTLTALQSGVGNKARFGDGSKYPSMQARIEALQAVVQGNAAKVAALGKDETRTEVARHVLAKDLAARTSQAVLTVKAEIETQAEYMQVRGQEMANEVLAPKAGYGSHDTELRQWMREAVKSPEGMAQLSALAKKDADVAAVIFHSKQVLTGLSPELHARMRLQAVERFAPAAYAMINEGVELQGLAKRYDKVTAEVASSFYSPHLADKGATRVEVD